MRQAINDSSYSLYAFVLEGPPVLIICILQLYAGQSIMLGAASHRIALTCHVLSLFQPTCKAVMPEIHGWRLNVLPFGHFMEELFKPRCFPPIVNPTWRTQNNGKKCALLFYGRLVLQVCLNAQFTSTYAWIVTAWVRLWHLLHAVCGDVLEILCCLKCLLNQKPNNICRII
jgi:hypothetical protein